jgi:quinohemoprotein ethanol dehydrogenase
MTSLFDRTVLAAFSSLLLGSLVSGCSNLASDDAPQAQRTAKEEATASAVDAARIVAADPTDWLSHGRTYGEQRYSPLDQIDESNVGELGLAWSYDLASDHGVEATPLVADGVMYVSAPWSIVHALDAATGERLWAFDPEVPRSHARKICCGFVNRGVALWNDRVFVGTLDGRLIAIDRAKGTEVWSTSTVEAGFSYSITGAPRVVEGKVVIGNAGADLGARGYVSAYDAATGELAWRTYTVPGDPAKGFESPAMERAAKTWTGEWWKAGGGGTVWDGMAYDPDLRLLYVGTGNGSPHVRWLRSPGGGDNLYLSSILALRPETGSSSGTTRRRPPNPGTTPRPSTSCSPISRSVGARARCSSMRRRTASSSSSIASRASSSPRSRSCR